MKTLKYFSDRSDEANCTATVEPNKKPGINFQTGDQCHDWMFKCSNNKCIPYWWKCDSVSDCGEFSLLINFFCNNYILTNLFIHSR